MSQQPFENPQTPSVEPKAPIDQFFAAASVGLTSWRRWVLGLIIIAVIWQVIGGIPYLIGISVCAASSMEVDSPWFVCADGKLGASLIPDYVLTHLTFVIGMIGIWIVVKRIHKKSMTQVTTGRASFDYSRFLYAALVGLCVMILITVAYRFIVGVEVTFESPSLGLYLPFVLIALVLTPIQTSFEEVLFRGYIMQGLSLLTRNRPVLALVTAVVFTVPHLANPEPGVYGYAFYVVQIMSPGILFAALTLLDGGIELAAGFHAINNLFLGLIANTEVTALATPALFVSHIEQADLLPTYFVDVFGWVIVVAILNHKYKWFAYPWSRSGRA